MKLLKQAQTALEQRIKTQSHDETVLQQSRVWMQAISWGLIGTTAFGLGWLAMAKTEEIVVAPGTLQPIGSVKEIQMPLGGITDEILIKDGDRVKAGQVLMRLDTETSSQRLQSQTESLKLKQQQLALKQVELDRTTNLVEERINTLNLQAIVQNAIVNRFEALLQEGAAAELQYLQQKNKLQEIEGQLRSARFDGKRQKAILGQDTQRLKSEIAEIQAMLTETQVTLRYQELRSPVDGVVFDLKANGSGYTDPSTETVMKIEPFNALEARVEIPSSDIGFVRTGMNADVSIDSFPSTDFGVLRGTVHQVGSDALPPDASTRRNEYRYPVKIELATQHLQLKSGQQLPLQPGMSLTANIKLRKVSYLQMLLGGFQDKANSLREI